MRLLLALLAFLALGLAPLGLPAEARTSDDHCAEMAGMAHSTQPDQQDHGAGMVLKSCCTALAAALPEMERVAAAVPLRLALVAPALPVQHGVRREVEVPPPRA
ncbi:hypothetical protein [Sphingomonas astaxanthinifaciens]|nr:hypothetical protein [Sphingomonas astaxanthinifaciens]